MTWLPHPLPPQCKVIVTTAKSDLSYKALCQRSDTTTLTMASLTDLTSKQQIVKEHLAMHCKSLDEEQLSRIVSCKLSHRPIFLSVLANELRVFGVYSRLDYHLNSYLEASSMRDLWCQIIQRWIKDYSWTSTDVAVSDSSSSSSNIGKNKNIHLQLDILEM